MRVPRFAIPAVLAVAPVLFFHEVCLSGRAFLLRDLFNWFYPWRVFVKDSLARGDLPLWNPYSYAGTPFLANMQSGLLYPGNVVFWLLDFPSAMRCFLVIQFFLAAWFMYLLLRAHGCREISSLTGGIGYAYGGWMLVHIEFPNKLAAAAWLPLILLGTTLWWRSRRASGLWIGAVATACCITAGYPQTSYTLLLGAGVIWCGASIASARASRAAGDGGRRLLDTTLSMPVIVALGALIAGAQILPFVEALSRSAATMPRNVLHLSMSPLHFLDLIYPHLFGLPGYSRYWGGNLLQFWLGHFYVGLITLGLAVIGIVSRRRGTASCVALLALSSAFCLGSGTPLAPFCVDYLPGFSHFRWLSTTSILVAFSICWLAAFGLDRILDDLEGIRRLPRWLTIGLVAIAVAAAAAGGLALAAPGRFEAMIQTVVSPIVLPLQEGSIPGHLDGVRVDAIRSGLLIGILTASWLVARRRRARGVWVAALVPLALFVDLQGASTGINYAGDPAIYRETPPIVDRLRSRPDPLFRVFVPDATLAYDLDMYGAIDPAPFQRAAGTLLFNLNLPYRLFSASDGDPMWTSRWENFHHRIEIEKNPRARHQLLTISNVGMMLAMRDGRSTAPTDVPDYLPRAFLVPSARRAAPDAAINVMADPGWRPRLEVLVEDDFVGTPRQAYGEASPGLILGVTYTNNTVTIEAEAARDCYLVLTDVNYPGWRVTIDQAPAAIFTADYLFRGVSMPPGHHLVRFVYRPASVLWGTIGSLLGLAITAALLLRLRRTAQPSLGVQSS